MNIKSLDRMVIIDMIDWYMSPINIHHQYNRSIIFFLFQNYNANFGGFYLRAVLSNYMYTGFLATYLK